jgi:hypothetical protein
MAVEQSTHVHEVEMCLIGANRWELEEGTDGDGMSCVYVTSPSRPACS